jgi:MFS family permease
VIVSVPVGKLGDLIGRKYIVVLGYLTYLVMSLGFIFAKEKWEIIILFILYGIFYSIDAAQGRAFIADLEKERRATAMGAYNLVVGLVYLLASLIAGGLWMFNPIYAFIFAAFMALVAIGVFIVLFRKHRVDFV